MKNGNNEAAEAAKIEMEVLQRNDKKLRLATEARRDKEEEQRKQK
jgi:hypothetical protein